MADPPKKRTVEMKVLALGMSRSATESMCKALEELGYLRTYHGVRDLMIGQDGFTWDKLVDKKYGQHPSPITAADFDQLLWDCQATTDMPCAAFWSELMDAYPQAKVLLVERDVDAWYTSFEKVVINEVFSRKRIIIVLAIKLGLFPQNPNLFINRLFLKVFRANNVHEMAKNAKTVYRQHYDAIEAKAKAKGMPVLRMRIEQGWTPVCKFLGKERPARYEDDKLPRGNEWQKTAANTRWYQNQAMKMLGWKVATIVGEVGGVVAAAVGIAWWIRSRQSISV